MYQSLNKNKVIFYCWLCKKGVDNLLTILWSVYQLAQTNLINTYLILQHIIFTFTLGLLALAYWAKEQGDMHTLAKVCLVTGTMGLTFGRLSDIL